MSDHDPGTYIKGDSIKHAETRAEAVALVFEGYARDKVSDASYRELQEQAKEAGIPANQSHAALVEALAEPVTQVGSEGSGEVPEGDDPGASGGASIDFLR